MPTPACLAAHLVKVEQVCELTAAWSTSQSRGAHYLHRMAVNNVPNWLPYVLIDRGAQQNPVSRRRLARDIAEMVNKPYPNTELIPNEQSLDEACLTLQTGTRLVHVTLMFGDNYPCAPPRATILGVPVQYLYNDQTGCSLALSNTNSASTQAYTIKTWAIHLLSILDGETELGVTSSPLGFGPRLRIDWRYNLCDSCGRLPFQSALFDSAYYPWIGVDEINQDADESSLPQPTGLRGQAEPTTIRNLPNESLNHILDYLEVEDIVRFAQVWDRINSIVEDNVVLRNRELQCFVTKEHFTHSPLGIGVSDDGAGPFELESEFDLVSLAAFRDLRVRTSAYGFEFNEWLPLPLSEKHWDQVKGDALQTLGRLAQRTYSSFLHFPRSDTMDVLLAFMNDHVVKLFTNVEGWPAHRVASRRGAQGRKDAMGMLHSSEKGIEGLFSLFHLLLCLAVDNPEYVSKANEMVTSFQTGTTPTQDMPSPGRILMALLMSDVETDDNFMINAVAETVKRNVPALLKKNSELLYMEPDGAVSAYRLHHTFMGSLASYRALMFTHLFIRTVRPSTNGTTITQARDALFRRHGFPPSSTLAHLAAETRRVLAVDSFAGFLEYLGVAQVPSARLLSACLRAAVRESSGWDEAGWALRQDEALVLRRTAEHWSTLPRTEGLPACPARPTCEEAFARARALGFYREGTWSWE